MKVRIVRFLTVIEIVPLKLCPGLYCWVLHKLKVI